MVLGATREQPKPSRRHENGRNQERRKWDAKKEELYKKRACFRCEVPGHMANKCLNRGKGAKEPDKPKRLAATKEYNALHWTACTTNECKTHFKTKNSTGY